MKHIKHFVNSRGDHTWDFTYYYNEVVPEILKSRKDLSPILSSDLNGIDDIEKTLNKGIIKSIYYDLENDRISLKIEQRYGKDLIEIIYSDIINVDINCQILPMTIMAHEVDVTPDNNIIHSLFLLGDTEIVLECEKIEMKIVLLKSSQLKL
ncbi:hypothetical protein [Psychrobacter sp. M13]|uniref:hypothetical protein n=1 Tax=Psychrobacter sp. M13 TaxID=3067275 RepID=UPI00273C7FC9|nr:hypothetical protein [Psychrobacter sp. M13]WLP95606.1 hypothetical protein Q9G97_05775 [Psychrobacter sp. M13]